MPENDEKKYKKKYHGVPVYACQSDTLNPKLLSLAHSAGVICPERYKELMTPSKYEKELSAIELSTILETYFGFQDGNFEEYVIEGRQKTRFGKDVLEETRYTGIERTDKEWVSTGLASAEAKEIAKFGDVLMVGE